MRCMGLNHECEQLIDAHIIPKGFARSFQGDGPNLRLTRDAVREAVPQLGEYDSGILCENCDNTLGLLDKYAVEICRQFHDKSIYPTKEFFEIPETDGEKFAKFVLAVLWRASVSSRPIFAGINLGKYQEAVRQVVFGQTLLASAPEIRVLVSRLTSPYVDPSEYYTVPKRAAFDRWVSYGFSIGGFRTNTIIDSRDVPDYVDFYKLKSGTRISGAVLPLEETGDFRAMAEMVVRQMIREDNPSRNLRRTKPHR